MFYFFLIHFSWNGHFTHKSMEIDIKVGALAFIIYHYKVHFDL